MKTMLEHWKQYRDQCYPGELEGDQNKQLHQAFFAGALCTLQTISKIGDLPEAQADGELGKLQIEILEINQARADAVKARN